MNHGSQGFVKLVKRADDPSKLAVLKTFNKEKNFLQELAAMQAMSGSPGFPRLLDYSPQNQNGLQTASEYNQKEEN